MEWYYLLLIPMYKIIINTYYLLKLLHLKNDYYCWLNGQTETLALAEHRQNFKVLMNAANVEDSTIPRTTPTGYTMVANRNINVFDQFPCNDADIVYITFYKFSEASGVFKSNILESLNPLYWIQSIIFLPKKVLSYLGLNPETIIIKLLQLLYWMISLCISIVNLSYPDMISSYFHHIFQTILPLL